MSERLPWEEPLGALPQGDGTTTFRVWAPRASRVEVELGGRREALAGDMGVFTGRLSATPGDRYRYVLDGGEPLPDPCSRFQPEGVRGPSEIVDPSAWTWTDEGWGGLDPDGLVVYELHVGTFTPEGTFAAAADRLPGLRELGVTAVELMPVATFPGDRNWGYDGLHTWAPHPAYGGPAGLAGFVDAAHAAGLGVILDVVYNHVGPGSEALEAFGPYLTDRYGTPWGKAVNFDDADSGGVREWALQNAEMWVRDLHIDGLRVDAVHAIYDAGARHVLAELTGRVRAAARVAPLLIAESDLNDPATVTPAAEGGWGFDAQWADDFHHALHALTTGEGDGYYADFGGVEPLAAASARPFVFDGRYSPHRRRRHGAPAAAPALRGELPEPRPGGEPCDGRPPPGRHAAAAGHVARPLTLRPDDLHGRGARRAAAVPVLHRPHRPVHRHRHARGAAARVRGVHRLRRGGHPRPAGSGDGAAVGDRPGRRRPRDPGAVPAPAGAAA
jgi:maltooligosyltrehalose trehalohydrolase